ncbi:MAG TPA: NAD-dependent epimerase/dehydratase family protein [Paludibacteraceae bacterium]|nr:NAD-dependent epimerase/dehydratase family protein [Paludibacteraceae bacterium]
MKILVTGANGLLGHHVVMELLERHEQVSIIVRSMENIYFDLQQVHVFTGDFIDYETLKKAAFGCDAVIHSAAVTATNLLHYSDYEKVNVSGSANVLRVCNELGINRVVFISSSNTIGYGTSENQANERSPIQFPFTNSQYAQSKLAAEQLFFEASQLPDKHIIIINSCFLIGGFDTKNSSGRLVKMGYRKPLLFVPKGGKNFVPASTVAQAACNALMMGNNGEKYLVSGENLSFTDFFLLQKAVGHYKQLIIEVPDWILKLAGLAGDLLRKMGLKTDLSTINIRQLLLREYYSGEKAKAELKYKSADLKEAISEAIKWLDKTEKV